MAARRNTDLSDHVCAIVFSHLGTVRYFPRSQSCPFLNIERDNPLPPGSLSARAAGSRATFPNGPRPRRKSGSATHDASPAKVLYEQYLEQQDGYRLTMLTIDVVPDEDEPDEDEEFENSWSVHFERGVNVIVKDGQKPDPNIDRPRSP